MAQMTAADSFVQAVRALPLRLRREALTLSEEDRARAEELHLRAGWPMTALIGGAERPLGRESVEGSELEKLVEIASGASVHTVLDQVCRGYLTFEGATASACAAQRCCGRGKSTPCGASPPLT